MVMQRDMIDTKWAIQYQQQGIGGGSGIGTEAQRVGVDFVRGDSASRIEHGFGPGKGAERCLASVCSEHYKFQVSVFEDVSPVHA
ncbi:hypothetical protein BWQ96_03301 [Gracilariopsis chorda]|uniref:Uncharacterized protein n=1 Tax=Gracilariopsis chorda TaxID=448386 RepID=A0A2V3IY23_9FLOR|nr:hypothetical protein BWQ96_03301 [Gracilariopsis chorda]|eukprot:PXF46963.1 hypothetical protein BWQ96_03301 [Gracilariopsis chorda]